MLTPSSSPATDHRLSTWKLKANDGHVVGTVSSEARGHFADELRDALLETADKDRVKVVADALGGANVVVTSVKATNEPVEVTPCVVDGELTGMHAPNGPYCKQRCRRAEPPKSSTRASTACHRKCVRRRRRRRERPARFC